MKRMLAIAAAFILGTVTAAQAQPFLVSASVDDMDITDATGTFTVSVLAEVGFKATIYLSATAPTLPQAQIAVTPSTINAPYTDVATVTMTLTGPKTGGAHNIIIKAANGAVAAYDTVVVTIPNRSAWKVFGAGVIGKITGAQQFVLDKKNGIGWFAAKDSLRSYDGSVWTSYAWPKKSGTIGGMTIDSSGTLWVTSYPYIFKKNGTTWSVINKADTSTGLTDAMVKAIEKSATRMYSNIHTAPDGTVWILCTPNGSKELVLLKYANSQWTMYDKTNSQIYANDNAVGMTEMITDAQGNVWIWALSSITTMENGLLQFDGTYWTKHQQNLKTTPSGDLVIVGSDRNGSIWLRANGWTIEYDGVSPNYYYPRSSSSTPDSSNTTPVSTTSSPLGLPVAAVDVAPNGEIWAGVDYYLYDSRRTNGSVERLVGDTWYHYTIGNSGLPNDRVIYLSVDDAGNPWILTADGSLTILDGSAPPESVFNAPITSAVPLTDNQTYIGAGHLSIMPNPASSQATLRLHLPTTDHFRVRVVNNLGQQVALLLDEVRSAGDYGINVPVNGLTAGTYFVQITGGEISESCPLVVAE